MKGYLGSLEKIWEKLLKTRIFSMCPAASQALSGSRKHHQGSLCSRRMIKNSSGPFLKNNMHLNSVKWIPLQTFNKIPKERTETWLFKNDYTQTLNCPHLQNTKVRIISKLQFWNCSSTEGSNQLWPVSRKICPHYVGENRNSGQSCPY